MNNWQNGNLGDIVEIVMGQSPSGEKCNTEKNGVPLLNGPTEFGDHHPQPVQYTIDSKKFAQKGDLLFCVRGSTTGRMNWADQDYAIGRGIAAIRPKMNGELAPFIRGLIESNLPKLLSITSGSTFPNLSRDQLRDLWVLLPPVHIQLRIAEILGALDDKIECNRRINQTLEQMAQALYKHWFVDFGPFRDGEFLDWELGRIPKGWEVKFILECCELLSGGTPKTSVAEYWNGDIPWVTAKDISQSGVFAMDTERKITPRGVENSATKILPTGTVVVVARGSVGEFAMLGRDMAMNQTCYGLRATNGVGQPWVYLTVANIIKRLQQVAYGTVFDTITTTTFQQMKVVFAPQPIMHDFDTKVAPLFDQIYSNFKENQTLARTRDYLLSKLLSGEIEVKAAEVTIEDMV